MAVTENQADVFTVGRKSFTAVAVNTAAKTGEWIKSRLGEYNRLEYKSSRRDLVTEVDKGAELMIRNLIATHFPDHVFFGEESVTAETLEKALEEAAAAEYAWIVDPIDGTTNFVHGFPFYCVSIALAHRGELVVGVVYDPSHDEMFVAEKGKGAYLHGKPIRVSREERLSESLLSAGFPGGRDDVLQNVELVRHMIPRVRNIRMTGSAALQLAYIAAGRLTGYWERGLQAWDIAAGALLVAEAGGRITDHDGRPYTLKTRHIAATNGLVHDELITELKAAHV
jgi:myo-inositol-1(or 4)-monophosphatase